MKQELPLVKASREIPALHCLDFMGWKSSLAPCEGTSAFPGQSTEDSKGNRRVTNPNPSFQ